MVALFLSTAAIKGHAHITSCFLHHVTMHPNATMFPIITAQWHLPVCCNRESTEWILELLEMMCTDDLKRGMTPSIHELKIRVSLATFSTEFSNNMTLDKE